MDYFPKDRKKAKLVTIGNCQRPNRRKFSAVNHAPAGAWESQNKLFSKHIADMTQEKFRRILFPNNVV